VTQTVEQLLVSLRSRLCPMCAGPKRAAASVCIKCWATLPQGQRNQLYMRIGEGYEQAFASAMMSLGVSAIHLPPEGAQGVHRENRVG
jgi:hypothetical protein